MVHMYMRREAGCCWILSAVRALRPRHGRVPASSMRSFLTHIYENRSFDGWVSPESLADEINFWAAVFPARPPALLTRPACPPPPPP